MVLLAKQSRHFFYKPIGSKEPLEFWAQNGMICIVDQRFPPSHEKAYIVLTTKEFLVNVRGINRAAVRVSHGVRVSLGNNAHAAGAALEERAKLDRFVQEAMFTVREAWKQGCPDNPKHLEQMLRERRKSMLHAGASSAHAGDGSGAKSASYAPEGAKLPPLLLPGGPKPQMPKRSIIIP
jgi:hypothetical protein